MSPEEASQPAGPPVPQFEHPKILAVDLSGQEVGEIQAGGFNVAVGSFGTPMRTERSEEYLPVPVNGHLPGITEREIVFADLAAPQPDKQLELGEAPVGTTLWQKMHTGVLEPRPRLIWAAREYFERVYQHGGVFVLFADSLERPGYVEAEARGIHYGTERPYTNWNMLDTLLNTVQIGPDWGSEITVLDKSVRVLAEALSGDIHFTCVLEPWSSAKERWHTLATNKYGKAVAGVIEPDPDSGQGWIFVLPRITDKGVLARGLLEDLLPRLTPKLFPEDERQSWAAADTYAPLGVRELRTRIRSVRATAEEKVEELEGEIGELRANSAHLIEILTESGSALVTAVKRTLEGLGLDEVRDVDAEQGSNEGRLLEDLQIDPGSPLVLAEVKGIGGLPDDEEALEVQRNVLRRIREFDRTDVRGITIVNHQRSLPPTERNLSCFQAEQVRSATDQDVGLMTTWDLYRLACGAAEYRWSIDQLLPLFTQRRGRIEPIPSHYKPIGEVTNFYEQAEAIGIEILPEAELRRGGRIGLIGPIAYLEQEVASMQVDGEAVEVATGGMRVGVKAEFVKGLARRGMLVYQVG